MVQRLAWLKLRLLWNGLRRDVQRRIGFPLALALIAWGAITLALGYHSSMTGLGQREAAEFAMWAAFGFWVLWMSLPVVVFPLDENLDPQQFALLPVKPLALITSLGVSGLIAPSAVLLLILTGANIGVFAAQWPMAVLSGGLMLILMVVSGQLFTTAVSALFKTRVGRNMTVFVVLAIGLVGFSGQSLARDAIDRYGLAGAVLTNPASAKVGWLPPVTVQRIVTSSVDGLGWDTLGWVAVSLGWIVALAYLWHRLLQWILTTPTQGASAASESKGRGLARGSWNPIAMMARKEFRFYLRDPRQRMVWTGAVIFLGLGAASVMVGASGLGIFRDRSWLPMMAPVLVMFVGLPIALNIFGWERNAASYLFVLPVKARSLILGKNLAAGTAIAAESVVLALILAALSDSWSVLTMVPALVLGAIGCQMAVGNLVSVLAPLRLPREGTDVFAQATEQGCLAIGAQLISFFSIGLLMVIPASVAVLTVMFDVVPAWFTSLLALAWGGALYGLSLLLAGKLLRRRIPEVVNWVQVV